MSTTNLLLVAAAGVILLWPKLSASLPAWLGPWLSNVERVVGKDIHEINAEDARSQWVVSLIQLQAYCKKQNLPKAVSLCNDLCNELISQPPQAPATRRTKK